MSKTNRTTLLLTLGLAACFAISVGCGGGGGGGVPGGGTCAAPFDTGLSGTWQVTETDNGNNCGDPTDPPSMETVTVTQTGSTIVVTGGSGPQTLQLCGNQMLIPGEQEPEDGGITTTAPWIITFSSPTSFSGTATWVWTDGLQTCSGSFSIAGTKQ